MYLQLLDSAVVDIDPSTLSFSGHTEDYPYNDDKRHASISFRLTEPNDTEKIVDYLKKEYLKQRKGGDAKIKFCTLFEPYETDTRPKISVVLISGVRGMINPSSFSFCSDEHAKCILAK